MQGSDAGRILDFSRPPILLIGSGITRRYTERSPTWMELIENVAERIGIDKVSLRSFINNAKLHCNESTGYMPRLATDLGDYLNQKMMIGEIKATELFDERELTQYMDGVDPIKIMAASEFLNLRITDNPESLEELDILKGLLDVVPCVITTNYDTFIEETVFNNKFKVYSRVSDYYLSGSQGIGEIYKIHGTCTEPETMVLNESDYMEFSDRSKIVSAKILSVLCDYPMIILGHSLDDTDVRGIMYDLISSLDDDKMREVERNIVYVTYTPGLRDFQTSTVHFDHRGRRLSVRTVKTDDFRSIFSYIASMEASVSPMVVRKIRQVVKKVAIQEVSGGERYKAIGLDDISDEDADRLVVLITDMENLRMIEDIPLYTADLMVKEIMSGSSEYSPRAVVKFFLSNNTRMFPLNQYVPIFYFIKKSGFGLDETSEFMTSFINKKREQFKEKLKFKIPQSCTIQNPTSKDDVISIVNELAGYNKPLFVMYAFESGLINMNDAMSMLRSMYDPSSKDPTFKSNFNCAVTFMTFKDLGL